MLTKSLLPKVKETILLLGDSGVGKSSLAKWIHEESSDKNRRYLQLNIASLSEQLFESELFGHVKGSFTGAINDKKGFCEIANGGTLFLDEIGDLSLEMQKKILTLVDEKIYYSVGSTVKKRFNGRLIFATHVDLKDRVEKGQFRKDLYYRICGFSYGLKSLKELKNKHEIIYDTFFKIKDEEKKKHLRLTEGVKNFLLYYDYPGNFRELIQIIKYIVFVAEDNVEMRHIPQWIEKKEEFKEPSDNYYCALEIFEKGFIVDKLKKYHGKINNTSRKINISKVTLISKIRKYDINISQFKVNLV